MLKFDYQADTGSLYCHFLSRLDTIASAEAMGLFKEKVTEILGYAPMEGPEGVAGAKGLKIVFDLDGINYISSAFLRICILAVKTVGKDGFTVVNTEPNVLKVFKTAGLDSLFSIT